MGAPQYEQAGADVAGSGTANTIPRWGSGSPSTTLTDSGLIDNGTAIYTTTRDVGIGTTSPNAILSVYNAGTPTISLWNSSNYSRLATNTNDLYIDAGLGGAAGAVIFRRGSGTVDSARIDSTGNLLMAGNGTAANPIIANSTGVSGMYFPTAATVAIAANGSIAATFSKVAGAGVALGGTTGLVFDASGSQQGVKLRATPDSLDSQTLDCYQDGGAANSGGVTWTPALRFGGATTGITGSQVGRYTRIGNMVFAQGTIALSSKGSATGAASIAGLPTSANVAATIYYSVAIGYNSKVTFTGQLHGLISVNSSIVELYQTSTAGVVSAITNTGFAADSVLTFTVCYPVT